MLKAIFEYNTETFATRVAPLGALQDSRSKALPRHTTECRGLSSCAGSGPKCRCEPGVLKPRSYSLPGIRTGLQELIREQSRRVNDGNALIAQRALVQLRTLSLRGNTRIRSASNRIYSNLGGSGAVAIKKQPLRARQGASASPPTRITPTQSPRDCPSPLRSCRWKETFRGLKPGPLAIANEVFQFKLICQCVPIDDVTTGNGTVAFRVGGCTVILQQITELVFLPSFAQSAMVIEDELWDTGFCAGTFMIMGTTSLYDSSDLQALRIVYDVWQQNRGNRSLSLVPGGPPLLPGVWVFAPFTQQGQTESTYFGRITDLAQPTVSGGARTISCSWNCVPPRNSVTYSCSP